jgi:hypothetical protein
MRRLTARGGGRIDADTVASAGSWEAALRAAGGLVEAVQRVHHAWRGWIDKQAKLALECVRIPTSGGPMQTSISGGNACASVFTSRRRPGAPPPRASIQVGSGHR